jgi:hypothetical protein
VKNTGERERGREREKEREREKKRERERERERRQTFSCEVLEVFYYTRPELPTPFSN